VEIALKFLAEGAEETGRGTKGETFSSTMQDRSASDGVFVNKADPDEAMTAMSLSSLLYYVLIGEGGIADETA
jgi:hypothetical protein